MRTLPLLLTAVVLLFACLFRYDVQALGNGSSLVVVLDRWQGVVTRRDLPEEKPYELPPAPWESEGTIQRYPGSDRPWGAVALGFVAGVAVGGLVSWRRVKPAPDRV